MLHLPAHGTSRTPRPRRVGAVTALTAAIMATTLVLPGVPASFAATANRQLGGKQLDTAGVVVAERTPALPGNLTARGWLVADLATGDVLAARDPHGRYLPASTVKALTALTLIPRLDAGSSVTVSKQDVAVDGSKVGLVPGHPYRVRDLFTALMVVSGNDAANALASAAGGPARTAELMNAEARRLQARNTFVRNPSGLDAPGQVTSPYDLALIARAGMQLPAFRSYVSVRQSQMPAPGGASFQIYNHNRLLHRYPGSLGIKNGYTNAARSTYIGAARRGNRTLVVTLARAERSWPREAAALLDWGFAAAEADPVGELVEPLAADALPAKAAPAAPEQKEGAGRLEGTAAGTRGGDGGGFPWLPMTGSALLAAAAAVVARRRVVVRRRRRRRRGTRADPSRFTVE